MYEVAVGLGWDFSILLVVPGLVELNNVIVQLGSNRDP